jgi:hypothetical protein
MKKKEEVGKKTFFFTGCSTNDFAGIYSTLYHFGHAKTVEKTPWMFL